MDYVTVSTYFEISDVEIYGGTGTVGYARIDSEVPLAGLLKEKVEEMAEEQAGELAFICKVPREKIRRITMREYEKNTED